MRSIDVPHESWFIKGPLIVEGFLEAERCSKYLKAFNSLNPRPRSYQGVVDDTLRKCEFVELPAEYFADFQVFIRQYMEPFFGVSISTEGAHVPVMFRYPVGIGFIPHHDLVTAIELERGKYNQQPVVGGDFTIVIFLSSAEDYDGGEMYFPNHGVILKPYQGSVVAFPATEYFMHGIHSIKKGERYSVMCRPSLTR